MKCAICGRFMRLVKFFTNDHLDSFEESWLCDNHDFEQEGR